AEWFVHETTFSGWKSTKGSESVIWIYGKRRCFLPISFPRLIKRIDCWRPIVRIDRHFRLSVHGRVTLPLLCGSESSGTARVKSGGQRQRSALGSDDTSTKLQVWGHWKSDPS